MDFELRRLESIASRFVVNDEMEELLKLRQRKPAEFQKLPPQRRMAVGYYLSAREAHEELSRRAKIEARQS